MLPKQMTTHTTNQGMTLLQAFRYCVHALIKVLIRLVSWLKHYNPLVLWNVYPPPPGTPAPHG